MLDTTRRGPRGPVVVTMAPARCTPPLVERLKDVLATHPGTTEVHLQLVNGEREHAAAARRRLPGHAVSRR